MGEESFHCHDSCHGTRTTDKFTQTPFFGKLMSRDEAYLLVTFLHPSNNAEHVRRGQLGHNPLHKLGKVYTDLIKRFSSVYTPHQQLSLDEGMVPWRGHLCLTSLTRCATFVALPVRPDAPLSWLYTLFLGEYKTDG